MNANVITLSEVEFDARFPLIENHLNPNALWIIDDDGRGCLFETFGTELEFVRQQELAKVWTLVDVDDGAWSIVSGMHFLNRVGYFISRDPVPAGVFIEVHLSPDTD